MLTAVFVLFIAPVAIVYTPALISIDIRIFLNFALGLFVLFLGGFALFAPREDQIGDTDVEELIRKRANVNQSSEVYRK